MGFVRGLSAAYMEGTPAINDWVADLIADDEVLTRSRFGVVRERAAVGYRSEHYEAASIPDSPYPKMFAALWRESVVGTLAPGERLATMAALLHVDVDGRSFAGVLIDRSGLEPEAWLRRYLEAYLRPLLHCFYAHQLVFMPHGENIILVLKEDIPQRVILKDIAEEVILMDPDTVLAPAVERIRADVPDDLRVLWIFTDVFDCFLRFLNAILVREGVIRPGWSVVGGRRLRERLPAIRAPPWTPIRAARPLRRQLRPVLPEPPPTTRQSPDGRPAESRRVAAVRGHPDQSDRGLRPPRARRNARKSA